MKNHIIVDIDGTIANIEHRLHYIKKPVPDWEGFHRPEEILSDKPIQDTIDLLRELQYGDDPLYEVVLCTGRYDVCREATVQWLGMNCVPWKRLLMRKAGDNRPDTVVKPELLARAGFCPAQVLCIFEDRTSVVKKWRELRYTCYQVANGDY